jgi:hypothetical protein
MTQAGGVWQIPLKEAAHIDFPKTSLFLLRECTS